MRSGWGSMRASSLTGGRYNHDPTGAVLAEAGRIAKSQPKDATVFTAVEGEALPSTVCDGHASHLQQHVMARLMLLLILDGTPLARLQKGEEYPLCAGFH